jgi:hypothetical protein
MKSSPKTLLWTLGPALVFVLVLVGIGLYMANRDSGITAEYNVLSAAARDQTWPRRAPEAGGWELIDGRAADAYQAALDDMACRVELGDPDLSEAIVAQREAGGPLPPACESAVCRAIRGCKRSLAGLQTGSRMSDARSPLHVWSGWRVDAATGQIDELVSVVRFGSLASMDARQRKSWSDLAGVLRYGQDLRRGGSLLGVMIGVATTNTALVQLRGALVAGEIDAEGRTLLRRELRYVDESEPPLAVLFRGERLVMFSALLGPDALRPPHGLPAGAMGQGGVFESLLLKDLAERQWVAWESMEQHAGDSFLDRSRNYERIHNEAAGSINPLVRIGMAAYHRYDKLFTVAVGMQRLYRAVLGDTDVIDPIMGVPFKRTASNGNVTIESTGFDDPSGPLKGLEAEGNQTTLRITVPETRPASP